MIKKLTKSLGIMCLAMLMCFAFGGNLLIKPTSVYATSSENLIKVVKGQILLAQRSIKLLI